MGHITQNELTATKRAMLNILRFEEQILNNSHTEFPARYIAACNIRRLLTRNPDQISTDTIINLEQLMFDPAIAGERQSFFFFRETAGAITAAMIGANAPQSSRALFSFRKLLRQATGSSHRAATEALGSLPLVLSPPQPGGHFTHSPLETNWGTILERASITPSGKPFFAGRSLIQPAKDNDRILVAKFCRVDENVDNLRREAEWMSFFRQWRNLPAGFHIPRPVTREKTCLFRLNDLPTTPSSRLDLLTPYIAIISIAPREYFTYANEPESFASSKQAVHNLGLNSLTLGRMAASGIIHTAPIPLFHNRVQRHRREDNGLYDWPRGGRLDQWLASCRFPNLGLTGPRDFEHFLPVQQSGERFYWHIGCHFMSLLLVAASFFRNRDNTLVGLDRNGMPVDARHLFDAELLRMFLETIFLSYYDGFTGTPHEGELPVDFAMLAQRMIEEMGVDRHMEEILRQIDQQQMTDQEFRDFLLSRGVGEAKARMAERGAGDITLHTGPHLGGFNQQISIPELITASATMAATCVLGRYQHDNQSKSN